MKNSRLRDGVALLCAAAMLFVVACGGGGGTGAAKGTVVIDNVDGELWPCSFNPFLSANELVSLGTVYEPLVFVNALTGKQTNWLASSYKWNGDNTQLTFTIRSGVKWSDGKPFTADDVVFTFDLIKKNSPLDLQSVWSVLSDVKKQGSNQVVMTFQQAAVPFFYYIADQVGIVPQHIWSSVSDPTKYQDATPVGTGPFTMSQCTPQAITYTRNKSYWQPGKPQVEKVVYPAFTDNDPANLYLAQGKADWGGQFIPNIDSFYVSKDKTDRHYWFPPSNNVYVFPNLTKAPMSDKSFRQALAYAIDRSKVSKEGEYGYEPAGNQTGVVTPTFSSWFDQSQAQKYNYKFDPSKAQQMFSAAGYKKGSDGLLHGPDGSALSLHIINVSGYTDWVASVNSLKDNLKQIGIDLVPENLDNNAYQTRLFNGDFDLAYGTMPSYGPAPYYELKNLLFSGNTAPIGQPASTNFERWQDPKTDKLINDYAGTQDATKQHQIVNQLEGVMLENVPAIPVTESVAWYQYDTRHFSNWPSQNNFYAAPAPFVFPDWEVVLLNLQPK